MFMSASLQSRCYYGESVVIGYLQTKCGQSIIFSCIASFYTICLESVPFRREIATCLLQAA